MGHPSVTKRLRRRPRPVSAQTAPCFGAASSIAPQPDPPPDAASSQGTYLEARCANEAASYARQFAPSPIEAVGCPEEVLRVRAADRKGLQHYQKREIRDREVLRDSARSSSLVGAFAQVIATFEQLSYGLSRPTTHIEKN